VIIGVGIDIVEVNDLEQRLERGTLLKVFSQSERAYAEGRPRRRREILGARWAAKEAFLKALGTGIRAEWPLAQIEVSHDDAGRPRIRLGEAVVHLLPADAVIHLSLTHTPTYAAAVVIIEGGSQPPNA